MAEKPEKSRIVRLNIGGRLFATSAETLVTAGDSFFSALLSDKHSSTCDETGAYFIDRSPHYFAPILHYLRCGVLELPPGITRTSLLKEAEFYGLQKIVDHITHVAEGEKKKKEPAKKPFPFVKEYGCYANPEDSQAFMFSADEKLTCLMGEQVFTQAMVIHNHPVVPPEWKQDQTLERSFATFYQMHVQKGSFKMNAEGRGLILTLPGSSPTLPRQHLATLSKDLATLCVTSFSCSGGSGVFGCDHKNPHHFHCYKFHKF